MAFKVGNKVRIITHSYHSLSFGSLAKIVRVIGKKTYWVCKDDGSGLYFDESDLELAEPIIQPEWDEMDPR